MTTRSNREQDNINFFINTLVLLSHWWEINTYVLENALEFVEIAKFLVNLVRWLRPHLDKVPENNRALHKRHGVNSLKNNKKTIDGKQTSSLKGTSQTSSQVTCKISECTTKYFLDKI